MRPGPVGLAGAPIRTVDAFSVVGASHLTRFTVEDRMIYRALLMAVMVLGALAASWTQPAVAGDKKSDDYKAMIEARAATAHQDKNVQVLVESAFALYPLETAAKAAKPRYQALMNEAAEITLQRKDKVEAAKFLEVSGPLTDALNANNRRQLIAMIVGKSQSQFLKDQTAQVSGPLKKRGVELVDPEVATRGADKDLAELTGMAALVCIRPSTLLAERGKEPRLTSYNLTFPGANRATLNMKMAWYGAFLGTPYTSDIAIHFYADKTGLEVLGIDYTDTCFLPRPDLSLAQFLITQLNMTLKGKTLND